MHINLDTTPEFRASIDITKWIKQHEIEILNVTGSRAGKDPDVYNATTKILDSVFLLRVIDDDVPDLLYNPPGVKNRSLEINYPETVDEAVDKLISEMPLKDRVKLAGMSGYDIGGLHPSLELYVKNNFGLWGERKLLESCREKTGNKN